MYAAALCSLVETATHKYRKIGTEETEMRFKEKIVLVTGGSRGIGRGISEMFAGEGAKVVVNYSRDADSGPYSGSADELVGTLRAAGGEAVAYPADVSKSDEVKEMVLFTLKKYGRIDILVNNAGICPFADFLDLTEEIWDRVFAVNLKGTFLCSQAVARVMVEQKIKGRIICISSVGAIAGTTFQSHYCPTKAGVNLFVKSIATALGPHGITVNAVMPGSILTDLSRPQFKASAEVERNYIEKIPVGRLGAPEDVAAAVGFLATEEAAYINGASLVVDGGMIAHL
ncbi:MAG: SDR family NAD(P)-dependent oxidoreductase [Acidobacteriaceae bacterium]